METIDRAPTSGSLLRVGHTLELVAFCAGCERPWFKVLCDQPWFTCDHGPVCTEVPIPLGA